MWCQTENIELEWLGLSGNLKKYRKRMRCSKCGKNFKVFIRECDDHNCFHLYMPKHKIKVKIKKQKTKHERKRI